MGPRITQRDVAREAGVSHATVSLALSGHAGIPEQTAARIKSIAKRLGYAPDPMLSALSAYRKNQKQAAYKANLGWINSRKDPIGRNGQGDFGLYFLGAQERALEAGYQLEEICLVDYDYDVKRISKSLRSRGITGLLVGPVGDTCSEIHLDWQQFSAVRFGYSMRWPLLHTVTNSQFRTARTAVDHLTRLGYRRIGFAALPDADPRTVGNFIGGYWVGLQMAGVVHTIPLFAEIVKNGASLERLRQWIAKHRLDCIIYSQWNFAIIVTESLGISVPESMGIASITNGPDEQYASGIHQNARKIGAAGVDQLIALLHRNEKGIPETPIHTLVEGVWQEGKTVRDVTSKPPRKVECGI